MHHASFEHQGFGLLIELQSRITPPQTPPQKKKERTQKTKKQRETKIPQPLPSQREKK